MGEVERGRNTVGGEQKHDAVAHFQREAYVADGVTAPGMKEGCIGLSSVLRLEVESWPGRTKRYPLSLTF